METNELIAVRNESVTQLAEGYGFVVEPIQSRLDILIGKKKMFSYSAGTNTFFIYKTKYSKWLEPDRYLAYIRTCLKTNAPQETPVKTDNRYVVEPRGVTFTIYDSITGRKVEGGYLSQDDAYKASHDLNLQWTKSINSSKK